MNPVGCENMLDQMFTPSLIIIYLLNVKFLLQGMSSQDEPKAKKWQTKYLKAMADDYLFIEKCSLHWNLSFAYGGISDINDWGGPEKVLPEIYLIGMRKRCYTWKCYFVILKIIFKQVLG